MTAVHIADTGFVVALGSPTNDRYQCVRRFARRNDIVFILPERVYAELTVDDAPVDTPPVDAALDEGWVRVADSLAYANPVVSRTMDGMQRYIANADDRPADEVERADAALGALAAQVLDTGRASQVYVYTTDVAAGRGVETILAEEGYGDSVTFVNGFTFIDDLL